jgi:hypothetical protein
MTRRDKRRNQIEPTGQFRCDGDDADVGPRGSDRVEDVTRREIAFARGRSGHTQTRRRLRAAKVGTDEVAFEMRGKHASPARDCGNA